MGLSFGIPQDACGLRLCVIRQTRDGERLDLCETVIFANGAGAVDTVLRRAKISGDIGRFGQSIVEYGGDWWADVMNANGDLIDVLPMSREAWNSLKNKCIALFRHLRAPFPLRLHRVVHGGLQGGKGCLGAITVPLYSATGQFIGILSRRVFATALFADGSLQVSEPSANYETSVSQVFGVPVRVFVII